MSSENPVFSHCADTTDTAVHPTLATAELEFSDADTAANPTQR
ncbi:hypothetical protein [Gordonia mangrovi]|nr:hypothetical protein [Gordonia mangrovi]MDY6811992.1 hypothetical protein [Actinomycetota bacterium]UVF77403.1 hypothetical protein NWF22_19230 [Gordonia mangrovi]